METHFNRTPRLIGDATSLLLPHFRRKQNPQQEKNEEDSTPFLWRNTPLGYMLEVKSQSNSTFRELEPIGLWKHVKQMRTSHS